MRKPRRLEESAHPERWLVSYADFMTLLFALFVVLFASSHHDKTSIQGVSSAVRNGFKEMGVYSGNSISSSFSRGQLTRSGAEPQRPKGWEQGLSAQSTVASIDVVELSRRLNKALGQEIARQEVDMRVTPEGFVISLHELGFFDSGQARLLPGAAVKIKRIADILMQYDLDMRVEGHSDNVPIHNATFNSNWELSTARATAVAMMLLNESGFDPRRMSIVGFAEYQPAESNKTSKGRGQNRRVDIVVVSNSKSSEVQFR